MVDADRILDEMDAGASYPSGRAVARALCNYADFSDELCKQAAAIRDQPESSQAASSLRNQLWARIDTTPYQEQSALRLAVSCFTPDSALDALEAEHLIDWSREVGLSDAQILDAFHSART